MNNELFVENCFSLTPKDILHGRHNGRSDINYWLEDFNDPDSISISIGGRVPQVLNLEWARISYGKRAYLLCVCGLRVTKLYLPINGEEFKCRKCHKLQYQLNSFNRHSVAGKSLYKINRFQKLTESRESMSRILYNGNYTKRFSRFLGLCERAGLDSIVKGANDLRALINR